ncbi:hypothetical protein E2562_036064 [Oryza meyeriana var. granulata]|uniref:Uncharacterized protein n=1 Tax=Oryza meyeriana var. granulata TaxID=110450 RepID=A0A6G1DAF9_9ORYZ|nr:hypothetical protein E2562_036064 [Oryza meyeriana var. granulata]
MLCVSPSPGPCAARPHRPPARAVEGASASKNVRGGTVTMSVGLPRPATLEQRRRWRLARFQNSAAAAPPAGRLTRAPPPPPPVPARTTAERLVSLWDMRRVWWVCGLGYWVQGFRCFPWLALNFHLTRGLGLSPAALQLVQNAGNLPLVAKPLFGVFSDAVYINRAHRLPYISIGALLQLIAWGMLAVIPVTGDTFPTQMACILIGNLGASVTEVYLKLDPSIIGLSKVVGQVMVLSLTVLYNNYLKKIPLRRLVAGVQIIYREMASASRLMRGMASVGNARRMVMTRMADSHYG